MELIGSTLTATYARPKTSHFLPAISTMASSYRNTQPVLAMNPNANLWRTNSYYKSSGSMVPTPSLIQRESLDLDRARTMFYPSNRTALSTRYTPDDWYKSNQNNYRESESSRKSAERLRRDTIRLIQDRDQLTRRTQENTSKNIGERLNDIVFWKSELSHETDNMVTEIAALTEVKRRLERALAETEGPLQVRVQSLHRASVLACSFPLWMLLEHFAEIIYIASRTNCICPKISTPWFSVLISSFVHGVPLVCHSICGEIVLTRHPSIVVATVSV